MNIKATIFFVAFLYLTQNNKGKDLFKMYYICLLEKN